MPEPKVQTDNTSVRGILWAAIGLLLTLGVCMAALALLVGHYHRTSSRDTPTLSVLEQQRSNTPPPPHLEVDGPASGDQVIAQGRAQLHGYAWVNRAQGIVRIPLPSARAIVLQQGWPAERQETAP